MRPPMTAGLLFCGGDLRLYPARGLCRIVGFIFLGSSPWGLKCRRPGSVRLVGEGEAQRALLLCRLEGGVEDGHDGDGLL